MLTRSQDFRWMFQKSPKCPLKFLMWPTLSNHLDEEGTANLIRAPAGILLLHGTVCSETSTSSSINILDCRGGHLL